MVFPSVSADLSRFSRRKLAHMLLKRYIKTGREAKGQERWSRAKLANTERALRLINQDKALIVAHFHKFPHSKAPVFMGIRKILRIV